MTTGVERLIGVLELKVVTIPICDENVVGAGRETVLRGVVGT